ncbi:MAG: DUF2784 domain-containing protein [Rhodococcus sp.]|nr:DUF2784 domain-containing protein [Rhodococcus sp. (in: high G+C Gram-positive bacteria)]
MMFQALAVVVAVVHVLFVGYVVVGGFLSWVIPLRFIPAAITAHLAAFLWGFGGVIIGYDCPLTHLESWARVRGGWEPLPSSGFIEHYLTGVIYPESAVGIVQIVVAALVLISWIGIAVRVQSRRLSPQS